MVADLNDEVYVGYCVLCGNKSPIFTLDEMTSIMQGIIAGFLISNGLKIEF